MSRMPATLADNNLLHVTIDCKYCSSRFNVRNLSYNPAQHY